MNVVQTPVPKTWEKLFAKALTLIDEIEKHGRADPFWTFGGGTALMLRYGHRFSKDVDIFVPDPQSLGFVTPRLSEVAESIAAEYVEAAGYVKLFLQDGEIDFVAGPNLTSPAFELATILGRQVRLETSAEIIAKKMWHRGDSITGRDIFDFALVARYEPDALMANASVMVRHAVTIFDHLDDRYDSLKKQFDGIETLNFHPRFDDACGVLRSTLTVMLQLVAAGR